MNFSITHNVGDVADVLEKFPSLLRSNVIAALDRGAGEVAVEAMRLAPKAFTTLSSSMKVHSIGEYIRGVAPGVNYAEYVERGSGPAVGKARYMPDPDTLKEYVKRVSNLQRTGKKGSPKRARQEQVIHDRAWALARYIYWHGTKPHPFMAPAAQNKDSRLKQLLAQSVASSAAGVVARFT